MQLHSNFHQINLILVLDIWYKHRQYDNHTSDLIRISVKADI